MEHQNWASHFKAPLFEEKDLDATGAGQSRALSTVAVAAHEQELAFQSNAEDNYVLASSSFEVLTTTETAAASVEEDAKAEASAEVEEIAEDPALNELPYCESNFKMTEELFRKAKDAEPETPESYWSYSLYRGPEVDGTPQKVKVHYCQSKSTTERVIKEYFLDQKVVGFDIEWKAEARAGDGIKKNVSLVQLATEERIGLFHIALFPNDGRYNLVAPSLKKIMEDPEVTKVGVSIRADCTRLRNHLGINSVSLFELSHLYRLVKFLPSKEYKMINKRLVSLATQVQEHLHLPMFKGDVRQSDWSQALRMDQIIYAASDSYAGVHLFNTLETKRQALDPTPPRPYHVDEEKPIRLAENVVAPSEDTSEDAELEPEELTKPKRKYTRRQPTIPQPLALDPDFSLEDSDSSEKSPPPSSKPTQSPIVLSAEVLAALHRCAHATSKTPPACLRAYFIWYHNPSLSLADIAALLRDPPLQMSTVVSYILEAIKRESLEFEKERLKEIMGTMSKDALWSRYRSLAKMVDGVRG
ncbi:3 -5 exonuclease protein [Rutstroemia sp. NJR-2017a BBW]|nr:3 -5 exonuclease protein [Rutstroemia sp. NJR-2017a BBW]